MSMNPPSTLLNLKAQIYGFSHMIDSSIYTWSSHTTYFIKFVNNLVQFKLTSSIFLKKTSDLTICIKLTRAHFKTIRMNSV